MKRFMQWLVALVGVGALVAGCTAGQPFGPTLRSGCQQAELNSVSVKESLLSAVTDAAVTPERKAALKDCSRQMTATRKACDAAPSAATVDAENTQTAKCKTLVGGAK